MTALLAIVPALAAQQRGLYDPATFRTLHLQFTQKDWWTQLLNKKSSEIYIRANLMVDGQSYQNVGVRFRGGTSYASALENRSLKLPFRIAMDAFVPGQHLLGYTKINLNNGHWDPTFLREILAMRIMREALPAPKANHVKLVINNESWGVYTNMQAPNKELLREHYRNADGNRYVGESKLQYYGASVSNYVQRMPIRSAQNPAAYKDLVKALTTMSLQPVSKRVTEVPKLIDVDMAHRHQAVNALIGNYDGLPFQNYYIYADPYHEQLRLIPWDMNISFWNNAFGFTSTKPRLFFESSLWQRRYEGHLRNLVERFLDWKVFGHWATTMHRRIDAEVKADKKRLYSYADFQNNLATSSAKVSKFLPPVPDLKSWVATRQAAFGKLLAMKRTRVTLSDPRHTPQSPTPTQWVQFTVKAQSALPIHRVLLHYRTRGYFREVLMFDDGKHGDGKSRDGVYGIRIAPLTAGSLVHYYFSGEADLNQSGDVNFLPWNGERAAYRFQVAPSRSSVVIGEFLARNSKGIRDSAGDRDDWVELLNPTSAVVDLSGRYLTDNRAKPSRWAFPANTMIPAGGRLLVWADEEPAQGKLHANFKLAGNGEELALIDKDGQTVLDVVVFGPQKKDISTGRLFDRALSPFVTYAAPSPRVANELDPCGARVFSAMNPTLHSMRLAASGTMKIASQVTLNLSKAPASRSWLLRLGNQPGNTGIPSLPIRNMLGGPPLLELVLPTDRLGRSSLLATIPDQQTLIGTKITLQGISYDGSRFTASNGVEIGFCKK